MATSPSAWDHFALTRPDSSGSEGGRPRTSAPNFQVTPRGELDLLTRSGRHGESAKYPALVQPEPPGFSRATTPALAAGQAVWCKPEVGEGAWLFRDPEVFCADQIIHPADVRFPGLTSNSLSLETAGWPPPLLRRMGGSKATGVDRPAAAWSPMALTVRHEGPLADPQRSAARCSIPAAPNGQRLRLV